MHNEDAAGFVSRNGKVVAAWVFDGVTGINGLKYLPAASDAAWLVERASRHLDEIAGTEMLLPEILQTLVSRLEADWTSAISGISLPDGYDIPAACLILAKRHADGWQALRLGDSVLVADHGEPRVISPPESDLGHLETFLREEAKRRRSHGISDFKALLEEFKPQLMASRKSRNTASNHSILVADQSSLNCPEFIDLGNPRSLLLCTDGFYRAVDTYQAFDAAGLVSICRGDGGVGDVLRRIRQIEASDPNCDAFVRFKPADDATAVMLVAD